MADSILQSVMSGKHDNNIRFEDLRRLLLRLGFSERTKGGHFIYKAAGLPERVNIQPSGNMAKGYQIRQIRGIIKKYNLDGRA